MPDPFAMLSVPHDCSHVLRRGDIPSPLFLPYTLVSWLHTNFHLPFLTCNTILVVVLNILWCTGFHLEGIHPQLYVTHTTVVAWLGVKPVFQVLPVCPKCFESHPALIAKSASCNQCSMPLFKRTWCLTQLVRSSFKSLPESLLHESPFLQFPAPGHSHSA